MKLLKALASILLGWKPRRHYPAMVDGHIRVCNCGFYSAWDPQLRHHFNDVEQVS